MIRGKDGSRAASSARGAQDARTGGPGERQSTPPAGTWLFKGGDGRLTAYACTPGGLLRWTEAAAPLTGWTGPDAFEVPGWLGAASMARTREGYVHFAGLRAAEDGSGLPEVIVSTQFQPGRPMIDWYGLGAPALRGGPEGDRLTGPPRITVNQRSGSTHVLVSLRHSGILRRSRNAEGAWGAWKQVTAQPYPGEVVPLMPTGGVLEVLAVGPSGPDRWSGVGQGRFGLADRIPTPVVPGTPVAYETGPRRATYFWRYPGDGSLVAWRAARQGVQGGLVGLGGAGGRGAPGVARAVLGGYDCTVLAQTGADGDIEVTAYVTENEGYGIWWASIGGRGAYAPQVDVDAAGRVVVAAFDESGTPLCARQDTSVQGLAFGPWEFLV
ncbi:hypothetical protein HYE82_06685 [Streptomyces sp. BR123]|uniref:hypothetical protein n=1 Tax=Streptomyces sp. BR123 TaxID=2749828 RepID=UPI0015C4B86E|nr:hypothetical protein [Streptomyces sp. BR123]NXY94084.1 hypothetical protein [Streptomyces sp. BR123]